MTISELKKGGVNNIKRLLFISLKKLKYELMASCLLIPVLNSPLII